MNALLASHRREILDAAHRHRGSRVRLFGSFARGEEGPTSDVDMLVDFDESASILDIAALMYELETMIGRRVEIAEPDALHPLIRDAVLAEAIEL